MAVNSFNATNPPLTTKGDVFTFSTVPTRLGVGANDTVLTADSTASTGLKWATPSSGSMTQLATGTLSGSSVSINSIPSTYNDLRLILRGAYTNQDGFPIYLRFNGDSTANRHTVFRNSAGANAPFDQTRGAITGNQDSSTGTGAFTMLTIPDYANTSTWKTIFSNCSIGNEETTPTNAVMQTVIFGAYNQTGAISSLDLLPYAGTFTGGTYILYGVK